MPAVRKPSNVHHLSGAFKKNPKRRKERENEPAPTGGIGACPEHLIKWQKDAREIWDEFVAMAAPGVLTNSDRFALAMLVRYEYEVRTDWQNLTDTTKKDYRILLASFGFDPANRSRVKVPDNKTKNKFSDLD